MNNKYYLATVLLALGAFSPLYGCLLYTSRDYGEGGKQYVDVPEHHELG